MSYWTTHELRRLDEAHRERRPTCNELVEMFPRHSPSAIFRAASHRGLRKRNLHLEWLTIAHRYFSRREAELGRLAR